ncbi:unnamed protein product [Rhizophagus irregularis]|nr:unnamed protein product [Rhizophagus irregularis]
MGVTSEGRSYCHFKGDCRVLNWVQQKSGITSSTIDARNARTVTQLEENLKSLEFNEHLGKNIEVPKKFEPVASTYHFGGLQ